MKAVDALYKEKEKAIKVFLDQEFEFKSWSVKSWSVKSWSVKGWSVKSWSVKSWSVKIGLPRVSM